MYQKNPVIGKGFDWVLIGLYALLVLIGLLCIFSVEYRTTDRVIESFLGFKKNYSKQFIFFIVCAIVGLAFSLLASAATEVGFALLLYARR